MIRVISIFVLAVSSVAAFDASALVQYCTASVAPPGDWWEGLELSKVWRIDDATGTNIVSSYGGEYTGGMGGAPWAWDEQGGLMSLRFGGATPALGTGKISFPPASTASTFIIGSDTSFAAGGWVWLNWLYTSGATFLFGSSTAVSAGSYQVTLIGASPYGRLQLQPRTLGFSAITNQTPLASGEWYYVAIAMYPRSGNGFLYTDDTVIASPQGAGTNLVYTTAMYGMVGNGLFGGAVRDFWIKHNGTTNDVTAVWNATRAIYGK